MVATSRKSTTLPSLARRKNWLVEGLLALSRAFRRQYAGSNPAEAMAELISVMGRTETNRDLLALARSAG